MLACAAMREEAALRQPPVPEPLPRGPLPALPTDCQHCLRLRPHQLQHALRHRVQRQAAQLPAGAPSQPSALGHPPLLFMHPALQCHRCSQCLVPHTLMFSKGVQRESAGMTFNGIVYLSMVGCDILYELVQDCPVPRTCAHAMDLPPHPCHFGPCPSCTEPCGMTQVRQPSYSFSTVSRSQRFCPESLCNSVPL